MKARSEMEVRRAEPLVYCVDGESFREEEGENVMRRGVNSTSVKKKEVQVS